MRHRRPPVLWSRHRSTIDHRSDGAATGIIVQLRDTIEPDQRRVTTTRHHRAGDRPSDELPVEERKIS